MRPKSSNPEHVLHKHPRIRTIIPFGFGNRGPQNTPAFEFPFLRRLGCHNRIRLQRKIRTKFTSLISYRVQPAPFALPSRKPDVVEAVS